VIPSRNFFADGVAEGVLTTLPKIQELMVIARHSSFVFKGQAGDIREIGRVLGARYVLEGSLRRAGNRVRLGAQLIDSLDGRHLWADRFDGEVDDVFDLQDRITQEIVEALEVRFTFGEATRIWRERSGSPVCTENVGPPRRQVVLSEKGCWQSASTYPASVGIARAKKESRASRSS
jgi:adenylate cyclase